MTDLALHSCRDGDEGEWQRWGESTIALRPLATPQVGDEPKNEPCDAGPSRSGGLSRLD